MNAQEKFQRVIDMVRKLRAHAEGGRTTEEQAAFAGKVVDLMTKYRLTEAMITGSDDAGEFVGSETWDASREAWTQYEAGTYLPLMAQVVATAHMCRIVVVIDRPGKIHFVGRQRDRALAIYMFDYLARTGLRLAEQARLERRRKAPTSPRSNSFKSNFLHGWVVCLVERYDEQRRDSDQQAKEAGQAEALVVVRDALVRVSQWLATQDAIKLDQGKARSTHDDDDAALLGVAAALDESLGVNKIGTTGVPDQRLTSRVTKLLGNADAR